MLPAKYNTIFATWQKRFAAWQRGERPPPYPAKIISQNGLAEIFSKTNRYFEGMGRWTEDVIIRAFLEDYECQILYQENSPLHRGFDFVAKYVPTGEVIVAEMKMSSKVGRLRTYLTVTKTKGRQMSLEWIEKTAREIRRYHPLAYREIINAINNNLLKRALFVANHKKKPRGWESASWGRMGIKGFFENEFQCTAGFS